MNTMTPIRRRLQKICRRYQVELMYTFGSRCNEIKSYIDDKGIIDRGTSSDVDIGIKISGDSRLSAKDKVSLAIELEDLLDIDRVDLAILPEVDPFVASNIVRGERLYCEDGYVADEYDLYILRRAGDLAPLERDRLDNIFRGPV